MTGPVEEYLRQLRASLRTRPEETSRILAEAEDHLLEGVAAGLAAGLTETEAAEAAISSFGTVRAVARHQPAHLGPGTGPKPRSVRLSGCGLRVAGLCHARELSPGAPLPAAQRCGDG
jgi:HAAS domain-containing protein